MVVYGFLLEDNNGALRKQYQVYNWVINVYEKSITLDNLINLKGCLHVVTIQLIFAIYDVQILITSLSEIFKRVKKINSSAETATAEM